MRTRIFSSQAYPSLEEIVGEFLKEVPDRSPEAACFGVAGPVHEGNVKTTNLPWHLEAESLASATRAPCVKLINDLQAAAYGMLWLAPEELETLHPEAASPPGNADFAARAEQKIELLRYLRADLGHHVSYERVLSGDEIHRIYAFLRDSGHTPEPPWLREQLEQGDPNATITRIGLAAEHPLCVGALEHFCSILAAEAGNLALRCMADSGIFIGGGIVPRILPALEKGDFVREFTDKGRFSEWMKSIPVRVALNPRAPLLGAAHFALHDYN